MMKFPENHALTSEIVDLFCKAAEREDLTEVVDYMTDSGTMAISEPIVMASAAGWYVGQICIDAEDGWIIQPWQRLTEYCDQKTAEIYWEPINTNWYGER